MVTLSALNDRELGNMARILDDHHGDLFITVRCCEALSAVQLQAEEIAAGQLDLFENIVEGFLDDIGDQIDQIVENEFRTFFGELIYSICYGNLRNLNLIIEIMIGSENVRLVCD